MHHTPNPSISIISATLVLLLLCTHVIRPGMVSDGNGNGNGNGLLCRAGGLSWASGVRVALEFPLSLGWKFARIPTMVAPGGGEPRGMKRRIKHKTERLSCVVVSWTTWDVVPFVLLLFLFLFPVELIALPFDDCLFLANLLRRLLIHTILCNTHPGAGPFWSSPFFSFSSAFDGDCFFQYGIARFCSVFMPLPAGGHHGCYLLAYSC